MRAMHIAMPPTIIARLFQASTNAGALRSEGSVLAPPAPCFADCDLSAILCFLTSWPPAPDCCRESKSWDRPDKLEPFPASLRQRSAYLRSPPSTASATAARTRDALHPSPDLSGSYLACRPEHPSPSPP